MSATTFPRCRERGLLYATEGGERLSLGPLWASFTPSERVAWDRYAGSASQDEFGIVPTGVEEFFSRQKQHVQQTLFP